MVYKMKWVIFTTLILVWSLQTYTPERGPPGYQVRGLVSSRGDYEEYFGIPYAYTNTKHRFQAPLPVPPWDGSKDAIEEHIRCYQQSVSGTNWYGQEDCLTLNIFRPLPASDKLLPVMVFIHGGGFFQGSGSKSTFGPEHLISKGVVLVTFNYRLHLFGYLCLGIEEAPGNAGMKDQVAALRWVKENIRHFGGNPNDVTIFGESAGSASVSYHLLSPMSKGLFHKAILQSGSSLSGWAFQHNPIDIASGVVKTLGYNTTDPKDIYNILKDKPVEEIILIRLPRDKGNIIVSELVLAPCIENKIDGVEPFLTESPYNLLSQGKYNEVPLMMGFNNEEGLMFVAMENQSTLSELQIDRIFPKNIKFPTDDDRKNAATKMEQIYFGPGNFSIADKVKLSKLYGDPYLLYPTLEETELILKTTTKAVYNYKFQYSGYINSMKQISGFHNVPGAAHADELLYLFKTRLLPTPLRFLEKNMIEKMTTMWTNFAKFGNPTPEVSELLPVKWNATDIHNPELFIIDETFSSEPFWKHQEMRFWKEMYTKYRRKS